MKSIHLSAEVYRHSKDEDGWERDQTKNEPEPMLEFAREEKNLDLARIDPKVQAPSTFQFVPQVGCDVAAM
jgi:hypothetical protein